MIIHIHLSKRHDQDLLAVYDTVGRKEFNKIMKESLRAITRGGNTPPSVQLKSTCFRPEQTVLINLSLQSREDEDIRQLLLHVAKGNCAEFIRMAVRFYLGPQIILGSLMDDAALSAIAHAANTRVVFLGTPEAVITTRKKESIKRQKLKESKEVLPKKQITPMPTAIPPVTQEPIPQPIPTYIPEDEPESETTSDVDVLSLLNGLIN